MGNLRNYHKACVKVIAKNANGEGIQGSGVLFRTPKEQIVLVTAAHVYYKETQMLKSFLK